MPNPPDVESDPYAPQPTFWQRNELRLAAAAVFVFTATMTVLAFPPNHAPEFAYAMLAPGIFWAYRAPSLKWYAGTLFAAQAVAWTILLGWLHHVTWAGLLLLGPFIGAWVGLWYLAAWWAMPRMLGRPTLTRLAAMLGLAAAWVLIEWTRTWLLTGFPWLPLAASQWERASILQIAAYTGQGGIAFVLVAMNIGFATMAHSLFVERMGGWNFRRPEFLLALFLLMTCVSIHVQETFGRLRYTLPLARVAMVQPYIPQAVKWDESQGPAIIKILDETTLKTMGSLPDLILWPEASTPWAVGGDPTMRRFVESLSKKTGASMLVGSIAIDHPRTPEEQWYNAVLAVDPATGLQETYYAKRHLVPFGEYVPMRWMFGWLHKVVPVGDDFMHGLDPAPLSLSLHGAPFTAGPLICYEDVFPELGVSSARAGADFLVVATNDAWYGEGGAAIQHAAHSVLRAVETRRPVLRCGNGGWSGWIDEFGNVRAVLKDENGSVYFRGTRTITVTRDARWIGRNSFYVEHPDWFVLACVALAVLGHAALVFAPPP